MSYDDAGNLTEKAVTDLAVTGTSVVYVHDAWNRLVRVDVKHYPSSGSPQTYVRAEYSYNGLHQCVKKVADVTGSTTPGVPDNVLDQKRLMYYDASWRLLHESIDDNWSSSSSTIDRHMLYVWGLRGQDDIAMRFDNRNLGNDSPSVTYDHVWYHLTDCQGSTVAVIDSSGNLVERVAYDAYGGARHQPLADLNGDGQVTTGSTGEIRAIQSLGQANSGAGTAITSSNYNPDADLNRDGVITSTDHTLAQAAVGSSSGGTGVTTAAAPGALNHNAAGSGTLAAGGITDNVVGYCGYLFNSEVPGGGLYTVRFRSYDPATGRWIERDPAGYVDGMSMYGYCGGGPVGHVDPFGLEGDYPPDGSTYSPDGSTTYRWTDDAGQHVVTFTHENDANGNYKGTRATVNDNTAKAWALKNWGDQLLNQKELQGEIGEQIRQDQFQHADEVVEIVQKMEVGAKAVASVNPLTGVVVSAADFKDKPSATNGALVVVSIFGFTFAMKAIGESASGAAKLGAAAEDVAGEGQALKVAKKEVAKEAENAAEKAGKVVPKAKPKLTQWGWQGGSKWNKAVKQVANGGTLERVEGSIPTQEEAEALIEASGGKIVRIEPGHSPPNPHTYPHINYTTASGEKGTVRIQSCDAQ